MNTKVNTPSDEMESQESGYLELDYLLFLPKDLKQHHFRKGLLSSWVKKLGLTGASHLIIASVLLICTVIGLFQGWQKIDQLDSKYINYYY